MKTYDTDESLRLKQKGMELAAEKRPELLRIAREIAKEIAISQGDGHCGRRSGGTR